MLLSPIGGTDGQSYKVCSLFAQWKRAVSPALSKPCFSTTHPSSTYEAKLKYMEIYSSDSDTVIQ